MRKRILAVLVVIAATLGFTLIGSGAAQAHEPHWYGDRLCNMDSNSIVPYRYLNVYDNVTYHGDLEPGRCTNDYSQVFYWFYVKDGMKTRMIYRCFKDGAEYASGEVIATGPTNVYRRNYGDGCHHTIDWYNWV